MADIVLSRQNYKQSGETTDQYNGWKPNTISGAITPTSVSTSTDYTIPADFKDHKTVFVITVAAASQGDTTAANVTIKAGDTYQGVKDLVFAAPIGTSVIWLDSAKYVDEATGKITLSTDKAMTIFGYEMR